MHVSLFYSLSQIRWTGGFVGGWGTFYKSFVPAVGYPQFLEPAMAHTVLQLFPGQMMKPLLGEWRSAQTLSLHRFNEYLHELHGSSEYLLVTYSTRSEHRS